ncbi:hypothetical protein NHP21005_04170 [Helicobacter sp. NHP21005]|nr:hypothetical protein NHP21005_04170 [Helicobacter sp. NHP21005]
MSLAISSKSTFLASVAANPGAKNAPAKAKFRGTLEHFLKTGLVVLTKLGFFMSLSFRVVVY